MAISDITISAHELAQLEQERICIFDCRFSLSDTQAGRRLYQQGHIPGAYFLDLEEDLSGAKGVHGGRHPLPDAEEFSAKLRRAGVNQDTLVIAYDDNRLAGAARLRWLLNYYSHPRIKILDGGFKAWLSAGLATTETPHAKSPGNFIATPREGYYKDYPQVKSLLERHKGRLVDSREKARFEGIEEPIDPVAGHIPGAVNFPWQEVTDSENMLRPLSFHQQRWSEVAGAKEIVVYCGSGVTACVNLLSMEAAGVNNALLYPGSWSDWCSYPDSPIAS